MPSVREIVGSIDTLMGVKAVWGKSSEPVMCFGSRGDPSTNQRMHFMLARNTAEKAISQPYLVTIGGGEQVPDGLRGRVLELVRVTGVYGQTSAFVRDPDLAERLSQWPVAVVLSEVYEIEGDPALIDDLGFSDRRILANAYDRVLRSDEHIQPLWDALADWPVRRRWEVPNLPNFRDPGRVVICGSTYPRLSSKTEEGKRTLVTMQKLERDGKLAREVKERNRVRNGGVVVCEACSFSDTDRALFDAHHLEPLGKGPRWSDPDSFAVLCPLCHRWAHHKSEDKLQPLSIEQVRKERLL